MIASNEIMVTSGESDSNCLPATTIENGSRSSRSSSSSSSSSNSSSSGNTATTTTTINTNTTSNSNRGAIISSSNNDDGKQNEHQSKASKGPANAQNSTSRSQVSSDNENSSDHSTVWPASYQSAASKRSAQRRLEAAQKLNLILPQQQQQQQQPQPQQLQHQKNCLSTPIVITSDDLHHLTPNQQQHQQQQQAYGQFYQSASQQMLFDSLAHQLNNQGGDVSLFTGLPSCTPASADRLTASGINPFFLHAATASNTTTTAASTTTTNNNNIISTQNGEIAHNGGEDQMRPNWPDQTSGPQLSQTDHGTSTAADKHNVPSSNGYVASNYNNANTSNNHLDQRTKLTIADLHAASALSPIILSPLSFLGLSPEHEALLRYGYVSPNQHPLAGRAFTQADLNQLNHHHHQVYHLNQMYHGQRVEPMSTHTSYTLEHQSHPQHLNQQQQQQQQQMNHHQQTLQHHNQKHNHHHHQQQQQQAFEQQQQHQQQLLLQNHIAKDLTQQTSTANSQQAACTTATTTTSTTGHVYIPDGTNSHQIPLGSLAANHLAHQLHHQQPELNHVQSGGGGRVLAQQQQQQQQLSIPLQQRHFVTVAENNGQSEQRPPIVATRPQAHDATSQQQVPPPSSSSTTNTSAMNAQVISSSAGKSCAQQRVAGSGQYPAPVREQLTRQQLVVAAQEQPGPQQSGLLLMPADRGPISSERPAASSSSFAVAGSGPRLAQTGERPAIILYEPVVSSSPSRTTYNQLEQQQARDSRPTKTASKASNYRSPTPISLSNSSSTQASSTIATGKRSHDEPLAATVVPKGPELCSTATTNRSTNHGSQSCSPLGRLAIDEVVDKQNSSDNLVSDHQQTLGAKGGLPPQDVKNSSGGNNAKTTRQKKSAKKSAPDQSTTAPGITTIQDQDGNEVPVKKKSRGGRKKKLVTHDEMLARKNRSKERNRVAARRCRQKRKQFLDELRDKIDQLHELNQKLRSENLMLKDELDTIKRHHSACNI